MMNTKAKYEALVAAYGGEQTQKTGKSTQKSGQPQQVTDTKSKYEALLAVYGDDPKPQVAARSTMPTNEQIVAGARQALQKHQSENQRKWNGWQKDAAAKAAAQPPKTGAVTLMEPVILPSAREEAPSLAQLAEQAQRAYDDYLASDEYKTGQLKNQAARGAAMMQGTGIYTAPIAGAGTVQTDMREVELRAIRDYYKNQYEAEQSRQIMEADLAELETWTEEDRAALETYVNFRQNSVTSGGYAVPAQRAYNMLTAKYGKNRVNEIAYSWQRDQNARTAQELKESSTEAVKGKTGASILHSAATVPANLLGSVTGVYGTLMDLATRDKRYKTLDPNNVGNLPAVYSGAVRGQVAENISGDQYDEQGNQIKDGGGLRQAASYAYQGLMSSADSLARAAVGSGSKAISLGLAATGSFGQTVSDASQRGATPAQAVLLGVVNGGLEVATEYLPLDEILKVAKGGTVSAKQLFQNIFKQAAIEVTEEETSFLGSVMAESIILQEKSGYRQQIAQAIANGASYEDAMKQANVDAIMEAVETAITSAFSGGFSAGVSSGAANINNMLNQKQQEQKPINPDAHVELADMQVEFERETWDMCDRLAKATGRNIKLYQHYGPGSSAENGYFEDGVIYVNTKSGDPVAQIVSHELTHSVEFAKEYQELSRMVLGRIEAMGGDLKQLRQQKADLYAQEGHPLGSQAEVDQEIVAEYVAKNLLTNEQQIMAVAQQNRTLAEKIKAWVDKLLAAIGNKDAAERTYLTNVQNLYAKALQQPRSVIGTGRTVIENGKNVGAVADSDSTQVQNETTALNDTEELDWNDPVQIRTWAQNMLSSGQITEEEFNGYIDLAEQTAEESAGRETFTEKKHSISSGRKYSFAGPNARTANSQTLAEAKAMDEAGAANETIRQQTGWFKGMDGKWRWEIDDSEMKYSRKGDLGFRSRNSEYDRYRVLTEKAERFMLGWSNEWLSMEEQQELTELQGTYGNTFRQDGRIAPEALPQNKLGDYIDHHTIYEAYPQLRDAGFVFADLPNGTKGQYDPERNIIRISNELRHAPEDTIIHEIQHAIQEIEGFTGGASVEYWKQQRADIVETIAGARRNLDMWLDDIGYKEVRRDSLLAVSRREKTMEQHWKDMAEFKQNSKYARQIAACEAELAEYQRQYDEITHGMTAYEQYENTAGEIEARDVTSRRNLTAEERKNTPPNLGDEDTVFVDDTGISFDQEISDYPYDMQTVIQEYIDSVDENVLAFVDKVQNGQAWRGQKVTVGTANSRMVEDIARLTGVENAEDCKILMNSNAVEHIQKRHGANGEHDNTMRNNRDIARINFVLQNYDSMKLGHRISGEYKNRDGTKAKMVVLSKKINGTYFVIEAVPDTGKIGIVSAYMNRNGAPQVPDENAPSLNVHDELASAPNGIVPSENPTVKRQMSISPTVSRKNVADDLRGILSRGGDVAELRRYVSQLERGSGNAERSGRNAYQNGAGAEQSEPQRIISMAKRYGISVNEYLRRNWELYEVDGQWNEAARKALELERQGRKYSISDTDNQGRKLTKEQQEFFKNSKAKTGGGSLLVLYHQTANDFTVFDTRREGAGKRDNATPFGIFLKSTDKDIGLKGQKQMPLYANITNPLNAQNREELLRKFRELSPEYDTLQDAINGLDQEYHSKYEHAQQELRAYIVKWREEHKSASRTAIYDDVRFTELYDAEDQIVDEWTEKSSELDERAKNVITDALIQAGYDGVILHQDQGSFGRSTDAYIALHPNQVKNVDNMNPTSNPDIRYSISETEEERREREFYDDEKILEASGNLNSPEMNALLERLRTEADNEKNNRELPSSKTEQKPAEQKTAEQIRQDMPAKARNVLMGTQRKLLTELQNKLGVNKFTNLDDLKGIVEEIANAYLTDGRVDQQKVDQLFKLAYDGGIVRDAEFYEQYKEIKNHLRNTAVTISEGDSHDIADFRDFKRRNFGTLKIVKQGGLPVDSAYHELTTMAPELFPESITHPADQLVRMAEVARSIQVSEQNLNAYYGDDRENFRKYARHDFENAVAEIAGDLHQVKRFVEGIAETEEAAPTTPQEAAEYYKQLKDARRAYERVQAKNLLTPRDEMQVGRLLRGEILPEDLDPEKDYVKGITAVFEAKKEYERLSKLIAEYKRTVRAGYRENADKLLETANEWQDKKIGLAYSRETMERNIDDIVPDKEVAKAIKREYFEAVHISEAEATRFKTKFRNRVRGMNLSTKINKGNLVSEAHAVQLLGEAEDNIRVLRESRGRMKMRDGKTMEEWNAVIMDMWKESPGLDQGKIRAAVKEFRTIYDELFQMMNAERVRNGYEPVNYRQGYFPHFQPGQGDGILGAFGKALNIDTSVAALPTTINGLTHTFKPGIQWFGNAQERLGFNTAYDAVEGFDKYIEGVASVIYQTENIQKLRALAGQIRYRTSEEGIRKQVDEIRARDNLSEEEKQVQINSIYEHGRYTLSNFVNELDEYTNLLANKKSKLDRTMEAMIGRKAYAVMKAWEARVGANMIAGNLSSALTNFIPLTQAGAQLDRGSLMKGMAATLKAIKEDDGIAGLSSFLTNRKGSDPLVQRWTEKASKKLGMPMELIDGFTSESIVRAAYFQNLKRGMSETEALHQADVFASHVMADRSKGAMPTLFESRNPIFKAFTQFQLEVNNQFSEVFKDLPRGHRERGLAALTLVLLKYFLGAFLYNEVYEYFVGRRAALDPFGILNDTVGDLTGYELPNLVKWGTNTIRGKETSFETDKVGIGTAGKNLASNLLGELPFSSGLTLLGIETDGGRIPASSAVPDLTAVWEAATTEGWSAEKRWKEVQDELNKLSYVIPPFGGNQIGKAIKGAKAFAKGGSYSVDAEGNDILQYPVYKDAPADAIGNALRMGVFGKSALPEAQDWVASGFKSLNAKQTATYQNLVETGANDREAYSVIHELQNAQNLKGMEKLKAQQRALSNASLTDEEKTIVVGHILGTEMLTDKGKPTTYANFLSAVDRGLSVDDFMDMRSKGVDVEEYLEATDAGLNSDDARDLAYSMYELNEDEDTEQVDLWRLAVKSSNVEYTQLSLLGGRMNEATFKKAVMAYDLDVSPDMFVTYYEKRDEFDSDGNGDYTQEEVKKVIDAMGKGYTNEQKGVLWQMATGSTSTKNNPYSKSAGQKWLDAKAAAKEKG